MTADSSRDDRIQQLADAVRLHLDFKNSGGGDPTEWLARNAPLRDLLEPMLAADAEQPTGSLMLGDYELRREVGRGGMGVVYEARQVSLGRRVAVKVLSTPLLLHERAMWRFQREARLLAQLDHRGIVKVFDAGTNEGVPFYAMEFVDGVPLAHVVEAVRRHGLHTASGATVAAAVSGAGDAEPGAAAASAPVWNADYVRTVVLLCAQVADALAFAHAAGVVHRDVKPANILVRRDGSALLSDFGIARQEDLPSMTATGEFAGTPFYVSPEQAQSREVDHRTDVFSLGVTLYELLTLRRPFPGDTTAEVLAAIVRREPEDPSRLNRALAPDLAAVVLKAMAKELPRRYQSAGALAADLRAFLDYKPVSARRPTPWLRFRRWVRREPLKAALLGTVTAALAVVVSVSLVAVEQVVQKGNEAQRNLADYHRLALGVKLDQAKAEAAAFAPVRAAMIPAMQRWLDERAQPLVQALPSLRDQLQELRSRALPYGDADRERDRSSHPQAEEARLLQAEIDDLERYARGEVPGRKPKPEIVPRIAMLRGKLAAANDAIAVRATFHFASAADQFLHDQLVSLATTLGDFAESPAGTLAFVREQLAWAVTSERRCRAEGAPAWSTAIAAVAADPRFAGLQLRPQTDLLPLGADPASGLQEFVHLRSGAPDKELPVRAADGRFRVGDDAGIVFVLLPGGSFRMGSQRTDPLGEHYCQQAQDAELPVHTVTLSPFFLGKYEVTQAQWLRLAAGDDPSLYQPDKGTHKMQAVQELTRHNPVENVSWKRATAVLGEHGLLLPTEAQWEYACRAGTETLFHFGDDPKQFGTFGNISDSTAAARTNWPAEPGVTDGFVVHAPVGSFLPNRFGLHDMHGNVWEWCRDLVVAYSRPCASGDGLLQERWADAPLRALRGGSHQWGATVARSAARFGKKPDYQESEVGVRAARAIEP